MKVGASQDHRMVNFCVATDPGANVYVAGTFNNWNPTRHRLYDRPNHGIYKTTLPLPSGRHEYKFVVNGQWRADPRCPAWRPNDQGTLNSIISV